MNCSLRTFKWAALLVIITFARPARAQQPMEVSPAAAEEHLAKRVDPEYPPLAKMASIQGKVVVQVRIAKDGSVAEAKVVSGHPLLVGSAVNAVKQWKYKPFLANGSPVEARTTIEVPFSLGIPDNQYKEQQKINNAYFAKDRECRSQISSRDYAEAVTTCKSSVELAEKLPPERALERTSAYADEGWALMGRHEYSEALDYFKKEVALDEKSLNPYDVELGYGYHHLGIGLLANGDLKGALENYQKAIHTVELARQHINSKFLAWEYTKSLKKLLAEYSELLLRSGDAAGATEAKRKADSIQLPTTKPSLDY